MIHIEKPKENNAELKSKIWELTGIIIAKNTEIYWLKHPIKKLIKRIKQAL